MYRGRCHSAAPRLLRALATLRAESIITHGRTLGTSTTSYLEVQGFTQQENRRTNIGRLPSGLCHQCFSTGFTSVHGERPSAEYAKVRKESLESEFGAILGSHSSKSLSAYFQFGPFWALYRAAVVSFHVLKLSVWHLFVHDIHKRAMMFRETLIHLGPFYIKLGQALSTRPDILPSAYCQELSKLQDQIPPFPTRVAIRSIESQLGASINQIFAEISQMPIAAASLGQVYRAHLKSGEVVAVKVQRPGMSVLLTLDALLFNMIGGQLKRFAKARKDLLVAVNEMVRHMFEEIDYILEAQNAERFALLYAFNPNGGLSHNGKPRIKVPKIYWSYTRKEVLTMEWINGIKLTDTERINKANLNRKQLIDQGVYCSLRQLLEEGFFHADPHPGNLVATNDGSLAYFDFGMMGDIPRHYRVGLIQVLVHYVNRDAQGLANDFLSLGFIPDGADIGLIAAALQSSFGKEGGYANDFQGIMAQLYDIMYEYEFSLPPDYALVIRALGSLEGTAKALDPSFKVVESAYPFIIGRLLSDPNPDMRRILRELLIRNNGSIRWARLERLITAISEEASESVIDSTSDSSDASIPGWKTFNMRAVVSATEDLLNFILSEKGRRVRIFLVQDILEAFDAFLEEHLEQSFPCFSDGSTHRCDDKGDAVVSRLIHGLESFRRAVALAPEVWTAMLIRMTLKTEVHRFCFEIMSALGARSSQRLPTALWVFISRLLHMLQAQVQNSHSFYEPPCC